MNIDKMSECPICFEEKELIIKYQCKSHKICENCFNKWHKEQKKRKCPQCRSLEIGLTEEKYRDMTFNLNRINSLSFFLEALSEAGFQITEVGIFSFSSSDQNNSNENTPNTMTSNEQTIE